MKKEYYIKYKAKYMEPDEFWYIYDPEEISSGPIIEESYIGTKKEMQSFKKRFEKSLGSFTFYLEKASKDVLDKILLSEIIT